MAIPPVPLRGLGSVGIITDVPPYDAPANAWTSGLNVSFRDGSVVRSTVFREAAGELAGGSPAYVLGAEKTISDYVVIAQKDGTLTKWANGSETDVTPTVFTPATSGEPFTGGTVGNVSYINRANKVPLYMSPADVRFSALPGWDSTWRTRALRSFKGTLVALGVTKGAIDYPQMIKWSDVADAGVPPSSWDILDTTKRAGENVRTDLTRPLVDGQTLGDLFYAYTTEEIVQISFIGGRQFFAFRTLFENRGVINANCVVEVDGYHYVFGATDIYRHNGVKLESLVSGKVHSRIFPSMTPSSQDRCFVVHNARLKEVYFCFSSVENTLSYSRNAGCNMAMIYNYRLGTCGFMDLPGVPSATVVSLVKGLTYDEAASGGYTYATIGGTYSSVSGGEGVRSVAMVVPVSTDNGIASAKLVGLDGVQRNTLITYPLSTLNRPAWVERVGLDLDELLVDVLTYKGLSSVHPQMRTYRDDVTLDITCGAQEYANSPVVWDTPQSLNPKSRAKRDSRVGGRYLALRVGCPTIDDFELSSVNLVITNRGRRAA